MARSRFVPTMKPNPQATLRLYCFHHAGGAASGYRPWVEALAPNLEVRAVQLPGRESRLKDAPLRSVGAVVQALLNEPGLFDEPFALFGHSLGGLIAFEMARALAAKGCAPKHLFVSGAHPPQQAQLSAQVSTLSDEDLLAGLRPLIDAAGELPWDPELAALLLPTLRSDLMISESYRFVAAPPLVCPVTALCGKDDASLNAEILDLWREHTHGRFCRHLLPGGHFYLVPERARLLELIVAELASPTCPKPG